LILLILAFTLSILAFTLSKVLDCLVFKGDYLAVKGALIRALVTNDVTICMELDPSIHMVST
jgi:hypothetical protein